jgi:type IV conjugative transfer system coupling protein TraD
LSLLWWRQRGISQKKTRHVRGTKIVTANQAKRYLKVRLKASPIEIAGVPMVKHTERYHILFVGDSGVGKTVAIKKHLQQIRKLNHKVILVDTAGDLTKYFYREGHDHILNPFDKRCNSWSFWGEITEEPHYEEIMEAAIKNDGKVENGDFWTNASRIVVAEILRELRKRGQTTNKALASHLFYDDLAMLKEFLENTCASRFVDKDAGKMSYGILAHFVAPLQMVRYLPDNDRLFSIRDWVADQGDDSWLFLTAKKDHLKLMRPMISMWLDCAKSALFSLGEDFNRKLWFMIDELPALRQLDSFHEFLTEGRKYGACVGTGLQNIASLKKWYGDDTAIEITSNLATKVLFRSSAPETSKYISEILGEEEILESQEQVSVGEHAVRGSTTWNTMRRKREIALPTEIQNLDELKGYLKLPGKYPVARFHLEPMNMPEIAPHYVASDDTNIVLSPEKFEEELKSRYEKELDQQPDNKEDDNSVKGMELSFDKKQLILCVEGGEEYMFDFKDIKQILKLPKIPKQDDFALKGAGKFLLCSGELISINELLSSKIALNAEIVSYTHDEQHFLVALNNKKVIRIPLDCSALVPVDRAEINKGKLNRAKSAISWKKSNVNLTIEELIKLGDVD